MGRQKDANKSLAKKQKLLEGYKKKKIDPYIIEKYKTYLDWFELIYVKEGELNTKDLFSVNIINKKSMMKKESHEENKKEEIIDRINKLANSVKIEDDEKNKIKNILEWQYKFKGLEQIPTKTSVTKIKEQEISSNITAKPKFLNEEEKTKITSAEKGTLMHMCVQKMDEKQAYNMKKIEEMILSWEAKEIITELEANSINKQKLLDYTKSELWNELKNAKEVHKEQPFYINIKANSLYENLNKDTDEKILVQGVIDLYYIDKNDDLILVDYKTDYVEYGNEYELVEKYKEQLELYRIALEQALNRKVDKMCIYSLYLNKSITINDEK